MTRITSRGTRRPTLAAAMVIALLGALLVLVPATTAGAATPQTFTGTGFAVPDDFFDESDISVPVTGEVVDIDVTIAGMSHEYVSDLDLYLTSPSGTDVELMADAGGSADVDDVTWIFDDSAANLPPAAGGVPSGTYRPGFDLPGGGASINADDDQPGGSVASTLAAFRGESASGTWTLRVSDDSDDDLGSFDSWSLSIVIGECVTGDDLPENGTFLSRTIAVTSTETVTDADLYVFDLDTEEADEIDMFLRAPGGGPVAPIMSDAGGDTGRNDIDLHIDDEAPGAIPSDLVSGRFQPTDLGGADALPAGWPTPGTALSAVDGVAAGGNWTLVGRDDSNDGDDTDFGLACLVLDTEEANAVPVAAGDSYTTDEDVPLVVNAAAGVLANDTDADADPLTSSLVSGPTNGTLTLNADGSFTYTPDGDFNGSDSFTYTASDGEDASPAATVDITVDAVDDAPVADDDAFTTDEDTPLVVSAPGVLDGDTDVEGSSLAAVLVSGPTNGTLTLNSDGSFTYAPGLNFDGSDSFTYQADDGAANSDTATVTITVDPVNDAPVAGVDAHLTGEDTLLTVDAADGLLDNDVDVDGDTLSITGTDLTGLEGTLVLETDTGAFTFDPTADFVGATTFDYTVSDGAESDTETVTITVGPNVNDAPVAGDDQYTTDEDVTLNVAAAGVLGDDTDVDSVSLSSVLVDDVDHGTLSLLPDGSFDYQPDADFNGSDSFTYQASDGDLTSNTATVTITVDAVNDDPDAVDDDYGVEEDSSVVVIAPGVLGNDTDVDGDTLTVTDAGTPADGTVVVGDDGSLTYTPDADFDGTDSFTYEIADGNGGTDTATVTVTVDPVNDVPVGTDDPDYTTAEDTPLTVVAPGVLANDSDVDDDPLTADLVDDVDDGTLVLNPDGSFVYTPDPDFTGTDSFTYEVDDGFVNPAVRSTTRAVDGPITVSIEITPVNDAPTAADDAVSLVAGTTLDIDVLANDEDVEGDPIEVTANEDPARGALACSAEGCTYAASADDPGGDVTFSYTIADPDGATDTAVVTITVQRGTTVGGDEETPAGNGDTNGVAENAATRPASAEALPRTGGGVDLWRLGTALLGAGLALTAISRRRFGFRRV